MNTLAERLAHYLNIKNGGNRSELARFVGVSATAVQKWTDGVCEPHGDNLTAVATFLGVTPATLKFGTGEVAFVAETPDVPTIAAATAIVIPEYRCKFVGKGTGFSCTTDATGEAASYLPEWFAKRRLDPAQVRRFRIDGDNMKPVVFPGDTVLVDMASPDVVDGAMYALRYRDQLRLNYLSKNLDGSLVLRNVNSAYKDEDVDAELAQKYITVIGRVRDRSGAGGL